MPQAPEKQQVPRVSPHEVRARMRANPGKVHLVCAYDDDEKCRQVQLEGALSLKEFQRRIDEFGPDDELVFYCA